MSDGSLQSISKLCVRCAETKPLEAFGARKGTPDGRKYHCRACEKSKAAEYREENRTTYLRSQREYSERNRQARRASFQSWYERNRAEVCARVTGHKRQMAIQRATPPWANRQAIARVYQLARVRSVFAGVKHEVDHIVPLIHPLVCGLHVHKNLQVLEKIENRVKSNRYWPDMPEVAHV